jgi:hypothetical protein
MVVKTTSTNSGNDDANDRTTSSTEVTTTMPTLRHCCQVVDRSDSVADTSVYPANLVAAVDASARVTTTPAPREPTEVCVVTLSILQQMQPRNGIILIPLLCPPRLLGRVLRCQRSMNLHAVAPRPRRGPCGASHLKPPPLRLLRRQGGQPTAPRRHQTPGTALHNPPSRRASSAMCLGANRA